MSSPRRLIDRSLAVECADTLAAVTALARQSRRKLRARDFRVSLGYVGKVRNKSENERRNCRLFIAANRISYGN